MGSGEFLAGMVAVDRGLLAGRPRRAAFLPTAAGEEGDAVVDSWIDLGRQHFRRLGVEPIPVRVVDRADADDAELANLIGGAGLVYLSGGNPGYLAETLRDTKVWAAIVEAWSGGAAVAGCSAGAGALTAVAPDVRVPGRGSGLGLGLVPHLAVIPHFDRYESWQPGIAERFLRDAPDDVTVVGIDEDTALVGGPDHWEVQGRSTVTVLGPAGRRHVHPVGDRLDLP
ncbi:MAG: cyanophycinase [Acidimicrobiales bacterium]|nr:cyanophycinase [Acidimicrobiales bacterium]